VFFAFSVFSVLIPLLVFSSFAQNPPALDSSEISRDLLFLAATRVVVLGEGDAAEKVFAGSKFQYRIIGITGGDKWEVSRAKTSEAFSLTTKKHKATLVVGAPYDVATQSDDDRAILSVTPKGKEPITALLWNRDQLLSTWFPILKKERPDLDEGRFREDLEVADAEIYKIDESIDEAWIAAGYSTGEAELGLGSIVHFDKTSNQFRVYHPRELATCAIVDLLDVTRELDKNSTRPGLWVVSRRQDDGVLRACETLMSFDHRADQLSGKSESAHLPGSMVMVMYSLNSRLYLATDAGLCSLDIAQDEWQCSRVVPSVTLKKETPSSNRPGDKPYGNLKPGEYEVLWANQNYLEVATKDSFDAWLAADDYAEAAANHFDTEPYKLLNTSNGGPAPIRPLDKPKGEPLHGALAYRAPLEKLPTPPGTPDGWVRIRARIGWIPRDKLDVVPKLIPVEK
jgi:hypothetical protein